MSKGTGGTRSQEISWIWGWVFFSHFHLALFPSHLNSKTRKMLQAMTWTYVHGFKAGCVVTFLHGYSRQWLNLQECWMEYFRINRKIFVNSWLKWICVTISMGNPVSTWPWQDWLHCYSKIRVRRMIFHLQKSQGRRGSGWVLALGLSFPGSAPWICPVETWQEGFMNALQAVLSLDNIFGFRSPGCLSIV